MRLYLAFVSLLFWGFVLLTSVLTFSATLVARLVTYGDARRMACHRVAVVWGKACIGFLRVMGVARLTIEGLENLPKNRACTIIANHGSQLDILCTYCTGLNFKWVSKASMKLVPCVGWGMWLAGYVFLKRDDPASIKDMLRECGDHLEAGSSVFVFPEGSRTMDGQIQAFKPGAFMIAKRAVSPIVPMVIEGTFAGLPRGSILLRQRMNIRIRLLKPIPADAVKEASAKAMAQRCEALYRAALESPTPAVETAGV